MTHRHQALLDPSNAAVALERAVALHKLGRTEEARSRYIQVNRLDIHEYVCYQPTVCLIERTTVEVNSQR